MTKETEALSLKIKQARNDRKKDEVVKENNGYQVVTEVIVNLFGCILVGTSLGVISNNLLETGDKFTILLSVFTNWLKRVFAWLWVVNVVIF